MWFRLQLRLFSKPIAATVGKDGELYWRMMDVIEELGRRWFGGGKLNPTLQPRPESYTEDQLISTEHVFYLMHDDMKDFRYALQQGKAFVSSDGFTPYVENSPILSVDHERGMGIHHDSYSRSVSIPDWIRDFKAAVTQDDAWP